MRKNNPKYKQWLKRRLKHLEKKRKKTNKKKHSSNIYSHNSSFKSNITNKEDYKIVAPQNFSIKDNPSEVSDFFDNIVKFTKERKNDTFIMFDLSLVEYITADAVLYLLAIMRDLQKLGLAHHKFSGNLPKNKYARNYIIQSGFLDYVQSEIDKDYTNSQCVQIMANNRYNQLSTKKICDFVNENTEIERKDTKFLYVLINEMMLNTCQHAYKLNTTQLNQWYMFVQKDSKTLKYTFLDIGSGIPKTVQKRFTERFWNTDSSIIVSALNGDFRTATKKEFRGKGLPKIKECVFEHKLNNFTIISNKGYCSLKLENNMPKIEESEMKKPIVGTIYYWEMNI